MNKIICECCGFSSEVSGDVGDDSVCPNCGHITGIVPDDYELCSYCGFDHEYEPDEAYSYHKTHPMKEE